MDQADLTGSECDPVPVFMYLWFRKMKGSLNHLSDNYVIKDSVFIITITIIISTNLNPDTTQIQFRKNGEGYGKCFSIAQITLEIQVFCIAV